MRGVWLGLLLCFAVTATVHAQAEPPAGFKEAIDQALQDLHSGYYGEARANFARAHALMPTARTFWGLGMAEFELRSYVACIEHLEQSLASDIRPLQAEQRQQATALLERARRYVTQLILEIAPASAHVELDDAVLEAREAHLSAGEHQLLVSAPGFVDQQRTLRTQGGDVLRLSFQLVPTPVALETPAAVSAPARDDRPRSLWKNPWLWTGVGVLVAGAAVTGGLLAARGERTAPRYGGSSEQAFEGL
ncbi:MAG TPA: hypothetical protein VFX59_22760 [Polyangiales bacterium]|nr:hypothetical protein [Polyangiales bacterium]